MRCLYGSHQYLKLGERAFEHSKRYQPILLQTRASASGTSAKGGSLLRIPKWSSIGTEWKAVGAIAVAVLSWYINAKQDRIQSRKEAKLELVTRQLKELYGPLYGNRVVAETSYRSAMKQFGGLKCYLEEARQARDAKMIKNWRSFVWNVLYPLDEQARELICKNAHLIVGKEFPDEFDRFLSHSAQMQFVMEEWKNRKGQLESVEEFSEDDFLETTNSTGIGGSKRIILHLRDRCRNLRHQQQLLMEDLSVDTLTMRVVNKILK